MSQRFFVLQPAPHPSRRNCWEAIKGLPDGMEVWIKEPMRTPAQNAEMWAVLQQIADLKAWPVNGKIQKQTKEFWKSLLLGAFRREVPMITQDLDGCMVVMSLSSRDVGRREWSDWREFLYSTLARFEAETQEGAA